jgi:hypothetical protein
VVVPPPILTVVLALVAPPWANAVEDAPPELELVLMAEEPPDAEEVTFSTPPRGFDVPAALPPIPLPPIPLAPARCSPWFADDTSLLLQPRLNPVINTATNAGRHEYSIVFIGKPQRRPHGGKHLALGGAHPC